jgi:aminoglycoside phosphotransferase (APT) family kinase protein
MVHVPTPTTVTIPIDETEHTELPAVTKYVRGNPLDDDASSVKSGLPRSTGDGCGKVMA